MAYLILNRSKLRHNYLHLDRLFRKKGIEWAAVSKLLCGNEVYLKELISLSPKQLCDARLSNLKTIKKLSPQTETIYIKPPPPGWAEVVVRYADISFNTQYRTMKLLSDAAVRQGKIHKVIVAIELGERREGVMPSCLGDFYRNAKMLSGIQIIGLGANFACLSGVLPSREKLAQLVTCRQVIAQLHRDQLVWLSGGSSVAIPLLSDGQVPPGINHFRVGETLFFGTDVYNSGPLPEMYQDIFTFYAEIIDLTRKPLTPDGELGCNLEGHIPEFDPRDKDKVAWRAIVDVGLLDVESSRLVPTDPLIRCIGASSDMLVINLGSNPNGYKTGDHIEFRTDYMGVLRLMGSRYIEKKVAEGNDLYVG